MMPIDELDGMSDRVVIEAIYRRLVRVETLITGNGSPEHGILMRLVNVERSIDPQLALRLANLERIDGGDIDKRVTRLETSDNSRRKFGWIVIAAGAASIFSLIGSFFHKGGTP